MNAVNIRVNVSILKKIASTQLHKPVKHRKSGAQLIFLENFRIIPPFIQIHLRNKLHSQKSNLLAKKWTKNYCS